MNANQIRRYEMLVRVRDFGNAHADLFTGSTLAQETFTAVAKAVEQLTTYTVSKLASVRGTPTKAIARATLHDRLAAISQTARVIAANTPDLEEKFVLPPMPSDQVLLLTARAFAREAEPIADRFIAHVMPPTFLADLEVAIGQFEQAIHQREVGKSERTAAREGITAALASGIAAARALDAMVANRLHDDPVTWAVWKRDRRVPVASRGRTVVDTSVAEPSPEPTPGVATPAVSGSASTAAGTPSPTAPLGSPTGAAGEATSTPEAA